MKITLTRLELTEMVINRFGLPAETVVEVLMDTPLADIITNGLLTYPEAFNNKIPRIKALRVIFLENTKGAMALADAKYAIENFAIFMDFVKKHNRWPAASYMKTDPITHRYVLDLR